MPLPPINIQRLLVPDEPLVPPRGFALIEQPIQSGLPLSIHLDDALSVVLVVPTGLASTWRDAEAATVVSNSAAQIGPVAAQPAAPIGATDRVPARLLVRDGGTLIGVIGLAAGAWRMIPASGTPGQGGRVELIVLGWDIRAGNLREPGDFGGRIHLAWRLIDRGSDHFAPPPLSPTLAARLHPDLHMESDAGNQPADSIRRRQRGFAP